MTGNPIERQAVIQDLATTHPEVEFALVLARTIESIKSDPEQLRGAVYELARQKLREQFSHEDASQVTHLTAALEVAIQGVEAHSRKDADRQALAFNPSAPPAITDRRYPANVEVLEPAASETYRDSLTHAPPPRWITDPDEKPSAKRVSFGAPLRFMLVVGVLLVAVALVLQRSGQLTRFWSAPSVEAAREISPGQSPVPADPHPAAPEPPKPTQLLPASFGVYAIDGDKLYELEPLPGRAPDVRVAVSAVVQTPSQTIVPDGSLRFIVYRRDSGNSAPDQADVRVVAKIQQATTFDAAGKPVIGKAEEDNWVIRNISVPYRTAPVKDNAEMYEVKSRDPDATLSPGRYALVVKSQAYDFTVAGTVTDDRQCLARLAAANGTFYSACQKQP
jgi:hypothetical protein